MEFRMHDEHYYLTAGDVLLRRTNAAQRHICFPSKTYRGINIHIDMEKTPKCLACILSDVDVEPGKLVGKFGPHENTFHFLRKNEHLSRIFREFYSIPDAVRKGYLNVKILEALLFLTGMELPEYGNPYLGDLRDVLGNRVCQGEQKHLADIDKKELLFIGLSGLATGASWRCCYCAIQNGDLSIVVPIDKMSILFTVLFSRIFLKETLTSRAISGLAMMCIGTLVMAIWT